MKICAYVQASYAKQAYKTECMDTRQFVGLRVVVDCLERAGYSVEYAGAATVHQYDIVLVSLTSDCDWWSFIAERLTWQQGEYTVIVCGAGMLHITPFLPFGDYFMFGRGENLIVPLIRGIEKDGGFRHESVACAATFNEDDIYQIAQVDAPYPHSLPLSSARQFAEGAIGCSHKCLFCGYTWQRKFVSPYDFYRMEDSLFGGIAEKELAMLDLVGRDVPIDFAHLRTTSIDGMSERLRRQVNKPISAAILDDFFRRMLRYEGAPHQIKMYTIVGYPGESNDDWFEFIDTLRAADEAVPLRSKSWSIVLHATPFRPMPATPLACAPMSYRNYRGELSRVLAPMLNGNLIYQGRNCWAVESMGTESLPTVILSAICHRGGRSDTENVMRIASSRKFWRASMGVKVATLEKYFDVDRLFGAFTAGTLPSRYLRTYLPVERAWPVGGEACG